jgi:hypothetical protein
MRNNYEKLAERFTLEDAQNGGEEDYYRKKFPTYPHDGPWPQCCSDCEEFVNYDDERGWFHVDPSVESCFLIGSRVISNQ